jgi:hypothetical protein
MPAKTRMMLKPTPTPTPIPIDAAGEIPSAAGLSEVEDEEADDGVRTGGAVAVGIVWVLRVAAVVVCEVNMPALVVGPAAVDGSEAINNKSFAWY